MKMLLAKVGLLLAVFVNESCYARQQKVKANLRASAFNAGDDAAAEARSYRYLQDSNGTSYPTLFGPQNNFYEAESLDYFRNINPDWFVWENPDEIEAGATTCGFLYPDLGLLPNVTYPIIAVYVCVRFANVQPAAKGNMFVHCGGPGSLSDCTESIMVPSGYFSQKNLDEFNIFSIDQRGMGRSWPSFAQEECSIERFIRDDTTGSIIGTDLREEDYEYLDAVVNATEELGDEQLIKLQLQKYKTRVFECWSVGDFNLNATQPDGTVRNFHFLEHSGTRSLAEDIWVMGWLLNAPKLHLYGISYGTSVFSSFATIFPYNVGLFVLDSNVSPNPDSYHNALTGAVGFNDRINYVIYSCSLLNARNPGSCPVSDLRECLSDINAMARDLGIDVGQGDGLGVIQTAIRTIIAAPDRGEELCAYADAGDLEGYNELVNAVLSDDTVATSKQLSSASPSQPTSVADVYGNPEYSTITSGLQVPIVMVRAQDRTGAVYDEDFFAKEVVAVGNRYTGAGTGTPRNYFFSEYAISFYWPSSVPLPPAGTPNLGGIIVGLLYDSNTPYIWAQEMRSAFPLTHLLTSKATNHGLGGDDYECQERVTQYLETGDVDFVDGTVCGDATESFFDDFAAIFSV